MRKFLNSLFLFTVILILGLIITGTINAYQVNDALINPSVQKVNVSHIPYKSIIVNTDSIYYISKESLDIIQNSTLKSFEAEKKTLFDSNTLTYLITLIISALVTLGLAFLSRATLLIDEVKNKFEGIDQTIISNEIEDTIISASEGIFYISLSLYSLYSANSFRSKRYEFTTSMCYNLQRLTDRIKLNISKIKQIDKQNKEIIVNHLSEALKIHQRLLNNKKNDYKGDYIENIIEKISKIHKIIFELKEIHSTSEKTSIKIFRKRKRGKF